MAFIQIDYHNHVDLDELLRKIDQLLKNQKNIMATIAELNTKLDELQTALDTEQQEVANALAELNTTITELRAIIENSGTPEQLTELVNKAEGIITDLKTTIPNLPAPETQA